MSEADNNNQQPIEAELLPSDHNSEEELEEVIVKAITSLVTSDSDLVASDSDSDRSDSALEKTTTVEETTPQTDWCAVAHKLRSYNRDLVKQVAHLEQTIIESDKQLRLQAQQQAHSDTIIIQQTEELRAAKEQVGNLCQELESFHQANQRQQILVETLSEQLEASQQQVARLERECAFVQQECNEQSHLLRQTGNNTQELRSRLNRQQRQTLQFKAALEKCLEVRENGNHLHLIDCDGINDSVEEGEADFAPGVFVPKAQPIKPWSSQFESWDDVGEEEALEQQTLPEAKVDNVDATNSPREIVKSNLTQQWENAGSEEQADPFLLLDELLLDTSSQEEEEEEIELKQPESTTDTNLEKSEISEHDLVASQTLPEEIETENKAFVSPLEVPQTQPKSPSPLIYTLGSTKKRKSLAAVELPAFGRALKSS